jgi:hypothetical protein
MAISDHRLCVSKPRGARAPAKPRNETDLERLGEHLAGAVSEAVQPSHVCLWLRPDTIAQRGRSD